jgi:hypothetical protein
VHQFSSLSPGDDNDGPARESVLELAEALQRSMLPQVTPQLNGVEVAFRYLPGNDQFQVGGDWFDAIGLPGQRVGLVVGDVMGHGVGSAAMMGQLRTAVQTLASLGLPPDELLRHLDEAARRLSDTHLATCLYGIYDPVTRLFTLANAGHLPPVLARPGEPGRLLEVPTGVPIGIGGHPFDTVEVEIADGDTLVLYTDGLVENPKREITEGLDALCAALPGTAQSLEDVCDTIIDTLNTDRRTDDAALLVARFQGIPGSRVASWTLEPTARAAGQARRLLRRTLRRWELPHLSEVAELLVTELIANTLGQASRPIGLRVLRTDTVTFEVHDDGHALPTLRTVDTLSESGRALSIVSSLATRWGTNRTETGRVVWFELEPAPAHAEPEPRIEPDQRTAA